MDRHIGPFQNRDQAGIELAHAIGRCPSPDCVVLAIPRGGVVVGYHVAVYLNIALDVIVPRKIPAPGQPELAIGAVVSWGDHETLVDNRTMAMLGVDHSYVEGAAAHELEEVNRRLLTYRGTTDPPDIEGKAVILVDDGIATGYTTRAAADAVRRLDAASLTLAVPVAPPDSLSSLKGYFDDVVCLMTPSPFLAVGYWYKDFEQVTDEQVKELLQRAHSAVR